MLQPYLYADGALDSLTALGDVNILLVMAETPYDADSIIRMRQSYNPNGDAIVVGSFDHFGKVEFDGAAYNYAAETVILANAFDRYVFANDATLYVIAGTGAITGAYAIASRDNGNQITLAAGTNLDGAGGNIADLSGFILRGRATGRYEWTALAQLATTPLPGHNEAGGSLGKGSSYDAAQPGVVLEYQITAA